jgi:hypothetical protein
MIVSDLNALELVESTEVIGGGYFEPTYYENDIFKFKVYSDPKIKGNVALSFGYADAWGKNTFTKVYNSTYSSPYNSYSEGFSVSATGGYEKY